MYRTIEDFRKSWETQREATLKILGALTDESLSQPVAQGSRTLGRIGWHVVLSVGEMARHAGLQVESLPDDAPMPASVADFVATYDAASQKLPDAVAAAWTDEDLAGLIDIYGDKWTRGQTLAVLMAHEIHHRGQMTVLMRQAGLVVPGVMGPAREEWAAYGMAPQA
ncbi:MAG: hypothetical protein EHM13_15405 [Acidobacteria bacterium]|nr:MAG: hypothetical protein EHM13_15405 [Acidobacteriota bacterium]